MVTPLNPLLTFLQDLPLTLRPLFICCILSKHIRSSVQIRCDLFAFICVKESRKPDSNGYPTVYKYNHSSLAIEDGMKFKRSSEMEKVKIRGLLLPKSEIGITLCDCKSEWDTNVDEWKKNSKKKIC